METLIKTQPSISQDVLVQAGQGKMIFKREWLWTLLSVKGDPVEEAVGFVLGN